MGFLNTLWTGTKSGASWVGGKVSSGASWVGDKASAGYKAFHDSEIGKMTRQTLGSVEKAVIIIADFTERKPEELPAKPPGGKIGGGMGIAGLKEFDEDLAGSYGANVGKLKAKLEKVDEKTQKIVGYSHVDPNTGDATDQDFEVEKDFQIFRFEVPFNPSEITLTGYGGEEMMVQRFSNSDVEHKNDGEQGDQHHPFKRSNSISAVSSHIEMTIPLIFDQTNNQDAFYGDKFSLGATNVARGVTKLVANTITGGGDYSVQNEVEAFTHIMRNKNMHLMKFVWGDMIYQGILNGVNAEYTMFNVNGEPCRATVNLRLVLLDDEYPDQRRIWMKKFKRNSGVDDQKKLQGAIGNSNAH